MIITRLLLVNYTRMAVAGIKRFLIEPDEAYMLQLILGTNGSGKSSLMHVMWGLPADKDDFGADGRFEIDIKFNGHHYQIQSIFEDKPHHHFIKDGVELNGDGKIGMCYALCEEHLKLTNEIRNLALGKELLTSMGPARRRYWLVKLADTDFTYAMNVYKKLTEAHRDATGAIKRLGKRLVDERNKLTPPPVVEQINKEYREIRELINDIYGMRNAQAEKSKDVISRLDQTDQEIEYQCREIDRLNTDIIIASGYKSREDMETAYDVTKVEITSSQATLQHYYTEHSRVKRKYDMLIKAGTETLTELTNRKTDLLEKISFEEVYLCYPTIKPANSTFEQALNIFKDIYNELYEKISSLKSNDGEYSREEAELREGRVTFDQRNLNLLEGRISRLKADIDHRLNHVQQDETTCPKCNHHWSSKASAADMERAEINLKEMELGAEELREKLKVNREYLSSFNLYAESYRAVLMVMRSSYVLQPYYNEILKDNRMVKYPSAVADDLSVILKDLEHQVEIEKHKAVIVGLDEQIDLKKNLDADTLEYIESEMNRLDIATSTTASRVNELNAELKSIKYLMDHVANISHSHHALKRSVEKQWGDGKDFIQSRYQEMLQELIMILQTQLARKEDVLSQITSQEAVVNEIEFQLNEAMMNERVAKAAHQALSPTSGAIAEGLHRFINVFVGKLNRVISSVWTYPLAIETFKMEEGQADLDYKFPFKAAGKEKPNKDVDEGSLSMIAIFNFAFSFCALNQLGLGYIPLFLDEFEAAFDAVHRERAIYFIKKLIDEGVRGQIFAISHYESNHGALSSLAQTCVLSRENLLLSSDAVYNQHVLIN